VSDFIVAMAGHMEGFTDDQIAQIEAAVPNAQALIALIQKNEPTITQALMLAQKLVPVANMVLTVLKEKQA
jgi:hypothetical protein